LVAGSRARSRKRVRLVFATSIPIPIAIVALAVVSVALLVVIVLVRAEDPRVHQLLKLNPHSTVLLVKYPCELLRAVRDVARHNAVHRADLVRVVDLVELGEGGGPPFYVVPHDCCCR
jgi:hypothetical protein